MNYISDAGRGNLYRWVEGVLFGLKIDASFSSIVVLLLVPLMFKKFVILGCCATGSSRAVCALIQAVTVGHADDTHVCKRCQGCCIKSSISVVKSSLSLVDSKCADLYNFLT